MPNYTLSPLMNLPERHTLGHTCKVHCYKNLEILTQRLHLLTNVKIKEFHDQKVLCTEPVLFIIAICNLFFFFYLVRCTIDAALNSTEQKKSLFCVIAFKTYEFFLSIKNIVSLE